MTEWPSLHFKQPPRGNLMPRVHETVVLGRSQAELDIVDVAIETNTRGLIDPRAPLGPKSSG